MSTSCCKMWSQRRRSSPKYQRQRVRSGAPLQDRFDAVRDIALAAPIHSLLTVTGVGFFDFLHEARGQAPNGFELHPVVSVVVEQVTLPAIGSETAQLV